MKNWLLKYLNLILHSIWFKSRYIKQLLPVYLFIFQFHICYSQEIVKSTGTKSGILVGSTADFAGISYNNSSDEFSFNYKFLKQQSRLKFDSIKKESSKDSLLWNPYPSLWGLNIGTGFGIEKNRSTLIADEKWQGGIPTCSRSEEHRCERIVSGVLSRGDHQGRSAGCSLEPHALCRCAGLPPDDAGFRRRSN